MNISGREVVGYGAIALLSYLFLSHGVPAIRGSPGFLSLITGVGIPLWFAKPALVLVGVMDILVVIALLFYRKWWVIAYAGLWPAVPATMTFVGMGVFSLSSILIGPILGVIVYTCFFSKMGRVTDASMNTRFADHSYVEPSISEFPDTKKRNEIAKSPTKKHGDNSRDGGRSQ